ncbi:hypothetical protein Tco_1140311, partial [Tanacetum coccineum]
MNVYHVGFGMLRVNKARGAQIHWGHSLERVITPSDIQHSAATQIWGCYTVSMANRLTTDGIKDGIFKKKENAGNKKSKDKGDFNMLVNIRSVQNETSIILCGDPNHFRRNCPRMNRATTSGGNRPNPELAIEGNTNKGNNRNQARGKAFTLGVAKAPQDPNIVTEMDWLSKLRAKIVCYEKIIQILLSNGDILEVHGEHPEGNLKQLKTMKVNELKLEDIPIVHEFPSVFPKDLSGLPPSREVEICINL